MNTNKHPAPAILRVNSRLFLLAFGFQFIGGLGRGRSGCIRLQLGENFVKQGGLARAALGWRLLVPAVAIAVARTAADFCGSRAPHPNPGWLHEAPPLHAQLA